METLFVLSGSLLFSLLFIFLSERKVLAAMNESYEDSSESAKRESNNNSRSGRKQHQNQKGRNNNNNNRHRNRQNPLPPDYEQLKQDVANLKTTLLLILLLAGTGLLIYFMR